MATNLKDLIEKFEDDIPSNIFTIEDKDPMVILGKINELTAYLKTLQATISSSDEKANQALENALNALTSASESLQASTTALNSSNKALETANIAIDTANTSLEGSNEAKTSSSEALDKANNALQIAQEALNQVVASLGSKVYDNNGNLLANVKFAGHNGVNVDLAEDNETIDIRLDEDITKAIEDTHTQVELNNEDIDTIKNNLSEINPKVARALLTPMVTPINTKIIAVDDTNSQEMLDVGEGLEIENGTLINKALKVDIIYDAKSTNSNINWGYTSGLGQYTRAIDLSKYKYLRFDYFTAGYKTGCTTGIVDLQALKTTQAGDIKYFGDTAGSLFIGAGQPFLTFGRISVNQDKTELTTDYINRWYKEYDDQGGSGRIMKIEGVY